MRTLSLALLLAAACANPSAGPGSGEPADAVAKPALAPRGQKLKTADGLHLFLENRRGTLYVRPDHHLGTYDKEKPKLF